MILRYHFSIVTGQIFTEPLPPDQSKHFVRQRFFILQSMQIMKKATFSQTLAVLA
jgi:hypothetical protein